LEYLVKNQFIDIRMFGSAFAVGGFTKAYTGAI
jgi:CRISPR-associated protein Csh2